MHLIIEQGTEVGKEITVPPEGMKFGRSPANDLVLADESVMLFQGRFFFKSDGSLWITDFSAAEKTTVDGETVDELQLKVGALIEVGANAFRVIHVKPADASTAAPAEEDEIDLGFKAAGSPSGGAGTKPKASAGHRLLQLVVLLLVLVVGAVAVKQFVLPQRSSTPVAQQRKGLSIVYESVRGNDDNIFRYHLEVAEDGSASLMVDDLKSSHATKKVKVSAAALETLSRRLGQTGFFEVEGDRVMDAPNRYELYDVAIVRNGRFNQVRVLNREPPAPVKDAVALLEEFVLKEMDVPSALLVQSEALLGYAAEAFKLGQTRFAERDVSQKNLALAVKHFQEAMVYLEFQEPKPELYRQAAVKLEQAKAEQSARYKDYMFNVDRAMRLGDWREAEKFLQVLAELIPDRRDKRNKVISSKQLDVEDHLR